MYFGTDFAYRDKNFLSTTCNIVANNQYKHLKARIGMQAFEAFI